ncbi:MAG: hypothetical protein NWF01_09760 [Candidatus Bathyarchaeota archaeon]|nr:hypothetical protein [Candidatus Bathyarchaeota archaeon]
MFLPPPISYLLIVVEAVLLALSGLFINKGGASYVGAVGGLLTAILSPALGLFTFLFTFLFGLFVDVSLFAFQIRGSQEGVNRNRLILAMAISTMLIAVVSYSSFALVPQIIPWIKNVGYIGLFIEASPMLTGMVLFMGPVTGAVAGYAAAYLWNKYLRNISI